MNDTPTNENRGFCSLESGTQMRKGNARLDDLNEEVTRRFGRVCAISSFYLYVQENRSYVASVLFRKDKDINTCEKSGVLKTLVDFVYAQLEIAGFGGRDEVSVQFHFESSESIGSGNRMGRVPTEEELARAGRLIEEESRDLDRVAETVKQYYRDKYPLYKVYLFPERGNFRACIFFKKDGDLASCMHTGVTRDIEDVVYGELERAGRGRKGEIRVAFEFDSDERVDAEFEGDYYNCRLRADAQPKFGKFGGEVLVL